MDNKIIVTLLVTLTSLISGAVGSLYTYGTGVATTEARFKGRVETVEVALTKIENSLMRIEKKLGD